MKKLLSLFLILFIFLFLLTSYKKNPHRLLPPRKFTLNGVEEGNAKTMIGDFQTNRKNDHTQKAFTVWFSCDQLKKIDSLLTVEQAENINVDGIRFYFSYDPAIGSGNNRLSLLLVSTRTRTDQDPIGGGSSHIDYYDSSMAFSGNGKPTHDENVNGAYLYDRAPCSGDDCQEPNLLYHYVDCNTGYLWVHARHDSNDTLNTNSEWLSLCFCQYLFRSVIAPNHRLDGLRIYLARGENPNVNTIRDELLFVPTYKKNNDHADYGKCIQDLAQLPPCLDRDSALLRNGFRYKLTEKAKNLYARQKLYPFFFGGGYDNGELCPDVCN